MKKEHCAVVIGGYVNGYSIIQELYENGVEDIILFDLSNTLAACSRKITQFVKIELTSSSLHRELLGLHKSYKKIVVFPTNDFELELLHSLHAKISSYCFLPFNSQNFRESIDKYTQYSYCQKLGVPFPETIRINSGDDLDHALTLQFPIIVKPSKKYRSKAGLFKTLHFEAPEDLQRKKADLQALLSQDVTLLASQIIPGDGSNVYGYVCYRSKQGEILNEWTGKKLAQFPNDFGVFSSASNQANDEVMYLGRKLVEGMNLFGICQPEFKFDHRDKQFKLMEINLRSMMWHRLGSLSRVNIQYTQFLDAIGEKPKKQIQDRITDIHFVYLKFELVNLLRRRGYWKTFHRNVFQSDKTYFAVFDKNDIRPFLRDIRRSISQTVTLSQTN